MACWGCWVYVTRLLAPTVGVLLVAAGDAAAGASGGTRLKASSISAAVSPFFSRNVLLADSADPRTCTALQLLSQKDRQAGEQLMHGPVAYSLRFDSVLYKQTIPTAKITPSLTFGWLRNDTALTIWSSRNTG